MCSYIGKPRARGVGGGGGGVRGGGWGGGGGGTSVQWRLL
jgi:hypothetical protein